MLVDGLDEITVPAARARFCRQIEQIHITVPRAPVIATSRIVGYREMGLRIGRGFEHATVLDLTADDKDEFVRKWCTLTEPVARRQDAEAELIKDIHSTDRIERLTGNPMLLTTMALVKKKVGKLPSRRADLYGEAVGVLLNWRSDVDEILDPREALPQLEYLAYAMCAAGVQQMRADEIISLLARMRREFSSVRAVRRHEPEEFLSLLERRTGIVVEIGKVRHQGQLVPAYEFRHLTFQEYLAGLALVEGRFPGRNRSRSLAENISPLAAKTSAIQDAIGDDDLAVSDNWREALRLCVMSCNDDNVDSALLAIATVRGDEDAQVTARPRAVLAMSCLADEPNVSEQVGLDLIDSFIKVLRESDSGPVGTTAARAISEVASSLWAPVLIRRLVVEWLSTADDQIWLAECAADAGMELIPTDPDALRRYLSEHTRELSSGDRVDRIRAALMIMVAAQTTWLTESRPRLAMVPGLATKLMAMLKRPGREAEAAAWAISMRAGQPIGDAIWSPSARHTAALIAHIKSENTTPWTACFLAGSLWADYSDDHVLARAISQRLASSDSPLAQSLGFAYQNLFPTYADPIIPLAAHSSAAVQAAAASTLGQLGDRRAVEPLIDMLSRSENRVRDSAARALGRLGDPRAVNPLLKLISAPDGQIDGTVAEALGRLGDPRALRPLLELLSAPDLYNRDTVAAALGELGDPSAVEPLIKLLSGDDDQVRDAAAFALGQIKDPRAAEPLIELMSGNDEARYTAAIALGRLEDPRAVGPLLAARQSMQSGNYLYMTVTAALAALGHDQALHELQDQMRGSSAADRKAACWALAMCEHSEQFRVLLSRDADGLEPAIDPNAKITDDDVHRYAVATRQSPDEVRRGYEQLQGKYGLRLAWRSAHKG